MRELAKVCRGHRLQRSGNGHGLDHGIYGWDGVGDPVLSVVFAIRTVNTQLYLRHC